MESRFNTTVVAVATEMIDESINTEMSLDDLGGSLKKGTMSALYVEMDMPMRVMQLVDMTTVSDSAGEL